MHGTGFRPSPYVTPEGHKVCALRFLMVISGQITQGLVFLQEEPLEYELPHLVMTYTALLCLAMLRDDFSKLDRPGILKFLGACQQEDGR